MYEKYMNNKDKYHFDEKDYENIYNILKKYTNFRNIAKQTRFPAYKLY